MARLRPTRFSQAFHSLRRDEWTPIEWKTRIRGNDDERNEPPDGAVFLLADFDCTDGVVRSGVRDGVDSDKDYCAGHRLQSRWKCGARDAADFVARVHLGKRGSGGCGFDEPQDRHGRQGGHRTGSEHGFNAGIQLQSDTENERWRDFGRVLDSTCDGDNDDWSDPFENGSSGDSATIC